MTSSGNNNFEKRCGRVEKMYAVVVVVVFFKYQSRSSTLQ